jgi:hypothetical protein
MNTADDWLHFGLGIAMLALGFVTAPGVGRRPLLSSR